MAPPRGDELPGNAEDRNAAWAILHPPLHQQGMGASTPLPTQMPPVARVQVPDKNGVEALLKYLQCIPVPRKERVYKVGEHTFVKRCRSKPSFDNELRAYIIAGNGSPDCTNMRGAFTASYSTGSRLYCTYYIATVALPGGQPCTVSALHECARNFQRTTCWYHGDLKLEHCIWSPN